MFIPPIHRKKPYTAEDRAAFYAPPPRTLTPIRPTPEHVYRDPPRPQAQKYSLADMHSCNGTTILLTGNKYLLDYKDKPLTGPYELRKRGLHPRDRWTGLQPCNPEYLREEQTIPIKSLQIAVMQLPSIKVERATLKPIPIRLIPQYEDLKREQFNSKGIAFSNEWS